MIQSSFRKPADLIASTVNYCHNSFSSFGRSSLCCLFLSLPNHCRILFQRCTAFGNERVLVSIMFVVLFCYFIIYLFIYFIYLFIYIICYLGVCPSVILCLLLVIFLNPSPAIFLLVVLFCTRINCFFLLS